MITIETVNYSHNILDDDFVDSSLDIDILKEMADLWIRNDFEPSPVIYHSEGVDKGKMHMARKCRMSHYLGLLELGLETGQLDVDFFPNIEDLMNEIESTNDRTKDSVLHTMKNLIVMMVPEDLIYSCQTEYGQLSI